MEHYIERHSEVMNYYKSIPNILSEPDAVLIQQDVKDTVWIIKRLENNVKLTIKINTTYNAEEKGYKNSIIQMQIMNNGSIKRHIRNGKVKVIYQTNKFNL